MAFENRNPLTCFWINYGLRNILYSHEFNGNLLRDVFQEKYAHATISKPASTIKSTSTPKSVSQRLPVAQKSDFQTIKTQKPSEKWQALAKEDLPEQWHTLLKRTKPAYAAWTYPELSMDLGPEPFDEIAREARRIRRAFLQNIIKELGQPAGTHTFWPCTIVDNNQIIANANAFWSGIKHLGCRLLFVFGQNAWEACGLPEEFDGPPVFRACYPTRLDSLDKLIAMPHGKLIASAAIQKAFKLAPPRPAR